jgi:hypothetical protein
VVLVLDQKESRSHAHSLTNHSMCVFWKAVP